MLHHSCRFPAGPTGGTDRSGHASEEKNDLRKAAPHDESTGVAGCCSATDKLFEQQSPRPVGGANTKALIRIHWKVRGFASHPIRISLAMNYPVRRRLTRSIHLKAVAASAATAFFFCFFAEHKPEKVGWSRLHSPVPLPVFIHTASSRRRLEPTLSRGGLPDFRNFRDFS